MLASKKKKPACRTSPLEAAGLGTVAPLADRQDKKFDPGVSVQLEQAKEQAYLPLREEKGKGKVKDIVFATGEPPTTDERTESENRMRC